MFSNDKIIETFLTALFGAVVIGIVVTNPNGVVGFFNGLAGFTSKTVTAFSGGFAGRTGNYNAGISLHG
jgi:hypothetical protein